MQLDEEVGGEACEGLEDGDGFEEAVATAPVLVVAAFVVVAAAAAAAADAAAAAERFAAASARLVAASAAIAKGDAGSGRACFGFPRGDNREPFPAAYGLNTRGATAGPESEWGGAMELA